MFDLRAGRYIKSKTGHCYYGEAWSKGLGQGRWRSPYFHARISGPTIPGPWVRWEVTTGNGVKKGRTQMGQRRRVESGPLTMGLALM